MKILLKILLPVLLIASAGLFGSTLYTYEMSMDTLKQTNTSLQKMAIANALVELKAGLDFNILNAISLAQTGILQPYLSKDDALHTAYAADARSRIVNMKNTYYYVDIGILNTDGQMLDHTNEKYIGESYADRSFFKEAMTGKVAIGAPYRDQGMVVYAVASPVYLLNTNTIIGVVFNVSKLTDTMSERMLLGDQGYLFVSAADGSIFIHRDSTKVLNKTLKDYPWGRDILHYGNGSITFSDVGSQKLAYFDTLPEAGWVAVAVRDMDELSAPGEIVRQHAVYFAFGILLVLALIVYAYVKSIIDALLKAVRYADQISKGVLDEDLDLGMSEKGLLAQVSSGVSNVSKRFHGAEQKSTQAERVRDLRQFNRNDELGVLYKALQAMVQSMRTMVEKADESSRLKSEFLANMSHEIRTPLNAVIGLAHLFLTSNEDLEKKRDYVVKIETAGKSLLGIINNVLDTSKIEAGMFELEKIHFSLREVGEQMLTIYQDSAAKKNIQLSFEIDPAMPSFYTGDPVRLGQIVNNLVSNAIKFTESGGVEVSCGLAHDLVKEEDIPEGTVPLYLEVRDTGIGFSKEQEAQLFKPFVQADSTITRRFGGTGLGLVISKDILEIMGGFMLVESEVGMGTTFTLVFYLPPDEDRHTKIGSEEEPDAILTVDFSDKKILVVEDNMINQLIMEEILEKTNAIVSIADNGQIAVDMTQGETFDLILMDMQMPVMDGIQATKVIRQQFSAEDLPIIAITANAMKEDREKGIAVGLNDYLTKPIDPRNLMVALHRWLRD